MSVRIDDQDRIVDAGKDRLEQRRVLARDAGRRFAVGEGPRQRQRDTDLMADRLGEDQPVVEADVGNLRHHHERAKVTLLVLQRHDDRGFERVAIEPRAFAAAELDCEIVRVRRCSDGVARNSPSAINSIRDSSAGRRP